MTRSVCPFSACPMVGPAVLGLAVFVVVHGKGERVAKDCGDEPEGYAVLGEILRGLGRIPVKMIREDVSHLGAGMGGA